MRVSRDLTLRASSTSVGGRACDLHYPGLQDEQAELMVATHGRGVVCWPKASATRQPQAIAHGGEEAECLGVPQDAIPLNPFAGESENH